MINTFSIAFIMTLTLLGVFCNSNLSARESKWVRKEHARVLSTIILDLDQASLAYFRKDRPGAIKIVNRATTNYSQLAAKVLSKSKAARTIQDSLLQLQTKTASEVPIAEQDYLQIISQLRDKIIDTYQMPAAPAMTPQFSLGAQIYAAKCAFCHGRDGDYNLTIAKKLSPPATNFNDENLRRLRSPFRYFNAIYNGFAKTSMPSFADVLTPQEIWHLAFWLCSFDLNSDTLAKDKIADLLKKFPELDLSYLAKTTDMELQEELTKKSLTPNDMYFRFIRRVWSFNTQLSR